MKVVITGVTGLLGRALAKALVQNGFAVIGVTRDKASAIPKLKFPCELVTWEDLKSKDKLKDVSLAIHLSGESIAQERWSKSRKEMLRDSRIKTAQALIDALKAANSPIQTFVTSSAIGIYSDRGEEELTEQSTPGTDFLSQLCIDWESISKDAFPKARWIALRTPIVLSLEGGYLEQITPVFASAGASSLGTGSAYTSWIHIEDWVRMVLWVLKNESIRGAVNVCSPNPERNSELTASLAQSLRVFRNLPVPGFVLRLMLGELASVVLQSQRVIPKLALENGFSFQFAKLSDALRDLFPQGRKGQFIFFQEQWIPKKRSEVFDFFSSETNLEEITPPMLNFHVLGKSTARIQEGTLIDYRLSLRGLPMKWRTRIAEWNPPIRFVDEQLKGPYKTWWHRHDFEDFAGGTLLTDRVEFDLPLGTLGRLGSFRFVMSDVRSIFDYRSKIIAKMFFPQNR